LTGFGLVYLRIDTIMLGLLGSEAAVGNYGVAVRVLETAIAVPAYFGNAFLATVAQFGAHSPGVPAQTVRALRYLLVICVPLAFGIAVAADPLVRLVAGGGYDEAGELLVRISPVLALMAAYAVLANLQIALDRTATLVKISVAGVAFKIALGAWAIPRYGANGAALAAVAGELMVVIAQWYSARDHFDAGRALRWCARLALSAGAMVAVGLLVLSGLTWVAALVAGLVAFAALVRLTACLSPGELRQAWSSLGAGAA
jgi:O-antigen/teichoic acid export membrane protein